MPKRRNNLESPAGPVHSRRAALGALLAVPAYVLGCDKSEPEIQVNLANRESPSEPHARNRVRLAIGTMLSPRETAKDYRRLADYLESCIGRQVQILQRRSYGDTNALLEKGDAEFAFVCTGAFLALKNVAELLSVPVVEGKSTYAALFIVRREDEAKEPRDLSRGRFALVDPLSLTGRLYAEWYMRRAMGEAGAPFEETVYTYSHSESVSLVASRRVRAASVDSLIYDRIAKTEPERVAQLRILHRSNEFGIPPFVAGPAAPRQLRKALRTALLEAHNYSDGKAVLAALGFDRFGPGDPKDYEQASLIQKAVLGSFASGEP